MAGYVAAWASVLPTAVLIRLHGTGAPAQYHMLVRVNVVAGKWGRWPRLRCNIELPSIPMLPFNSPDSEGAAGLVRPMNGNLQAGMQVGLVGRQNVQLRKERMSAHRNVVSPIQRKELQCEVGLDWLVVNVRPWRCSRAVVPASPASFSVLFTNVLAG